MDALMPGIVDSKLSWCEMIIPVIGDGVDIMPDHVLQHPVHPLRLSIRLWVVCA